MNGGAARQDPDSGPRGRGFLWLGALALLAGLTALFSAIDQGRNGQAGLVQSTVSGVVLKRDRSGHFTAEGQINGMDVDFMVDTGATDVAVPEPLARQLGLDFGPMVTVMTAAGPAQAWMTRLDEVRVGGLYLRNVRGTIMQGTMDGVLLGNSFLRHFSLSQQGDELVIEVGS